MAHNIYISGQKKVVLREKSMKKKSRKRTKKIVPNDILITWVNVIEPFY